ncbi:MAG: hypothetical protein SGBAC_006336 [Bacillariaceae sp.]
MVPDENRLIRVASLFDIHLCEWNLALRGYIKLAKLRRDKYGEEHELVADPYSAKAAVLLKLGKQKDASIAFAKALGGEHLKVADSDEAISNVRRDNPDAKGRITLSYLSKALAIRKTIQGESDLSVARIYQRMASIEGDDNEALHMLENALAIFENGLGEEHLSVAKLFDELAVVLSRLDQEERSRGDLENACENVDIRPPFFGH